MSIFTASAGATGETIKVPNSQTPHKELTVTIGQTVTIAPQRDFQTKEIRRNKNGQIADQWIVAATTEDGTEGRIFVDKFALKQAIGRAFLEAGVESFHVGDQLTITFEGQERLPSGFNANKYSAKVKHNGGKAIVEQNEIQAEENKAMDQARSAYNNAASAPAADSASPWAP